MKILLKVYYWIIFALSLLFELLSSLAWAIDEFIDFIDDKLLIHLMNIGKKIDGTNEIDK